MLVKHFISSTTMSVMLLYNQSVNKKLTSSKWYFGLNPPYVLFTFVPQVEIDLDPA